jgi:hypothetical protein
MFKNTLIALGLLSISTVSLAQQAAEYEVTITNITQGQTFTPQVVISHDSGFRMFTLGEPASTALEALAEGGDTAPLADAAGDAAMDIQTTDGLLAPGMSNSVIITGVPGSWISVAGMLIPTNDAFMALQRNRLPEKGGISRLVAAYDAGTESNDQNCNNIPGPRCGGEGFNAEAGEGFVHISNGFHDLGEQAEDGGELLGPAVYDWRNPVARIRIQRIN